MSRNSFPHLRRAAAKSRATGRTTCGLDSPALPDVLPIGVRVPLADLYDEDLHLLLRVRYTRGC